LAEPPCAAFNKFSRIDVGDDEAKGGGDWCLLFVLIRLDAMKRHEGGILLRKTKEERRGVIGDQEWMRCMSETKEVEEEAGRA
jgi:hypothetical protein